MARNYLFSFLMFYCKIEMIKMRRRTIYYQNMKFIVAHIGRAYIPSDMYEEIRAIKKRQLILGWGKKR